MVYQASCPSCGAPIEFGVANSVVTICDSCGTVAGRADGKLEDYGKVATLVQTDSPLQVGLEGHVNGVPYEVAGRVQLQHPAGGVWDEWYVAFRGGKRWGWLAEAHGEYYLTFAKQLPAKHKIPPVDQLSVEDELTIPSVGRMKIAEIGTATAISAEGEIPYEFRPGETYQYADLVGRGRKFATLDFSEDPPALYLGSQFPLERLGIESAESREGDEQVVSAVAVTCPNCGGSLDLKAPNESECVVCPYCNSLLDVQQGNLRYLETLKQKKVRPVLPLGSEGTLRGRHYSVIGFLERRTHYEGQTWRWQEYLLYTPREPFHWLIYDSGHWSLGRPVSPAEVEIGYSTARFDGKTFRLFDRSTPVVSAVYGEFYWKVRVGERVKSADFIAPPLLLSREQSIPRASSQTVDPLDPNRHPHADTVPPVVNSFVTPLVLPEPDHSGASNQEVNYTVSEYIPAEEIKQAFGLKHVRLPTTVAPNQPYPYTGFFRLALLMLVAACLAGSLVYLTSGNRRVLQQTFTARPGDTEPIFFSKPFHLKGFRNIKVVCSAEANHSWLLFDSSFYNSKTGKTRPFGFIGWRATGGKVEGTKFLSRMAGGTNTLRLHVRSSLGRVTTVPRRTNTPPSRNSTVRPALRPSMTPIGRVQITVYQGVPRLKYWLILVGALLVLPVIILVHHGSFERRRWEESDYSPYSSD